MNKVLTGTMAAIACSLLMTGVTSLQPAGAQPQNTQAKLAAAQRRAQAAQIRALQQQQRQAAAAQQRAANQQRRQQAEQAETARDHFVPDALQVLQTAKADLEDGNHDYNGHRVAALGATNKAIRALNEALAWDRQHEKFSSSLPSSAVGLTP